MREEELQALHSLNVSREYITRLLNEQISALTNKALSLRMKEDDRVVAIAGKIELENFVKVLKEKHDLLLTKQQKENKEEGHA